MLLLGALALACAAALADGGLAARARQQGKLTVGVDFTPPAYVAGAKFRTPEGIEQALAEDLARRLQVPLATRRVDPAKAWRIAGRRRGGCVAGSAARQ